MNSINVGDQVLVVATSCKSDEKYVGMIGTVSQIYNNKHELFVQGQNYISLHSSTIVKKVNAAAIDSIVLNTTHNEAEYHIEYSMDSDGMIQATLFTKQSDGSYKPTKTLNVNQLVWKSLQDQGVFI